MSENKDYDFLKICTFNLPESIEILKDELDFTVKGIVELCKEFPEQCSTKFAGILGGQFNYESEVDIAKLMKHSFESAENCADIMDFIYVLQCARVNKVVTPPKKQKKVSTPLNTSGDIVNPFRKESKQFRIYEEMEKWIGSKADFSKFIKNLLKLEFGATPNQANSAFHNAIKRMEKVMKIKTTFTGKQVEFSWVEETE